MLSISINQNFMRKLRMAAVPLPGHIHMLRELHKSVAGQRAMCLSHMMTRVSVRHWWGSTEDQRAVNTRHRDLEGISPLEYCFPCTWQQDVQTLLQTQRPARPWSPTPSPILVPGRVVSLETTPHLKQRESR